MKAHPFSIINDPRIDEKIMHDLKIIRRILTAEFSDNMVALFLVGGLGRGEGGVIVEDNAVKVVNDYDLHMVTRAGVASQKLEDVCKRLAKTVDVSEVDIFVQPIYASLMLRNTQYGYDLKHGSRLLYGNKNVIKRLPDSRRPHRNEIETLLFIRSWCFLGPIKREFFDGAMLTRNEKFFLFQQLSKALLAVEEAWLIYQHDYCPHYVEKLHRIKKYCKDKKTLDYFKWATNFKLRPSYIIEKPLECFFEIKDIFFQKMLTLINRAYNRNFNSWVDYSNWYLRRFDVFLKYLLSLALYRNPSYSKFLRLNLARVLLAVAFKPEGIDEFLNKKVSELFSQTRLSNFPGKNSEEVWWTLRKMVIEQGLSDKGW